jgi:hypothetical protein
MSQGDEQAAIPLAIAMLFGSSLSLQCVRKMRNNNYVPFHMPSWDQFDPATGYEFALYRAHALKPNQPDISLGPQYQRQSGQT